MTKERGHLSAVYFRTELSLEHQELPGRLLAAARGGAAAAPPVQVRAVAA
jgi:hypothetical protein